MSPNNEPPKKPGLVSSEEFTRKLMKESPEFRRAYLAESARIKFYEKHKDKGFLTRTFANMTLLKHDMRETGRVISKACKKHGTLKTTGRLAMLPYYIARESLRRR